MSDRFDLIKLEEIFMEVLTNTAQVFMGIDLQLCGEGHVATTDVSGLLVLVGEQPIIIRIATDRVSAIKFVSLMTGLAVEDVTDDLITDGVGELANIVAGRAKAVINTEIPRHTLTPPAVIDGDHHTMLFKSRTAGFSRKFSTADGKYGLTFELLYF